MKRQMIKIDEERCTGCGECMPNCPEGALRIMSRFDKIFLVTECASDIWGGSPQKTEDFMHAALWASAMMSATNVAHDPVIPAIIPEPHVPCVARSSAVPTGRNVFGFPPL